MSRHTKKKASAWSRATTKFTQLHHGVNACTGNRRYLELHGQDEEIMMPPGCKPSPVHADTRCVACLRPEDPTPTYASASTSALWDPQCCSARADRTPNSVPFFHNGAHRHGHSYALRATDAETQCSLLKLSWRHSPRWFFLRPQLHSIERPSILYLLASLPPLHLSHTGWSSWSCRTNKRLFAIRTGRKTHKPMNSLKLLPAGHWSHK